MTVTCKSATEFIALETAHSRWTAKQITIMIMIPNASSESQATSVLKPSFLLHRFFVLFLIAGACYIRPFLLEPARLTKARPAQAATSHRLNLIWQSHGANASSRNLNHGRSGADDDGDRAPPPGGSAEATQRQFVHKLDFLSLQVDRRGAGPGLLCSPLSGFSSRPGSLKKGRPKL